MSFDRAAIEELYGYTGAAWEIYAEKMRALPPDLLTRPAPGSGWPALRDAFQHVLGAYDGWINTDLALGTPLDPSADELATWEKVEEYRTAVRSQFRRLLDETSDESLFERFTKAYDDDGPETLSIADILANLLLHERGHHGDLSTLLYQHGTEPPFVDYRMYLYMKDNPGRHDEIVRGAANIGRGAGA